MFNRKLKNRIDEMDRIINRMLNKEIAVKPIDVLKSDFMRLISEYKKHVESENEKIKMDYFDSESKKKPKLKKVSFEGLCELLEEKPKPKTAYQQQLETYQVYRDDGCLSQSVLNNLWCNIDKLYC